MNCAGLIDRAALPGGQVDADASATAVGRPAVAKASPLMVI